MMDDKILRLFEHQKTAPRFLQNEDGNLEGDEKILACDIVGSNFEINSKD